jgi:hypothetical protein
MVDRKVVPFDEFNYQLKLMYLFHVLCYEEPIFAPNNIDLLFFFKPS